MTKAQQRLLGLMAPARSKGSARFQAETLRRGGPYEVMGKRWRGTERSPANQDSARPLLGTHLLRRMR